jgi:hypothetical protein
MGWGRMESIDLVKDRNRWMVLVNMVMNFRFPLNVVNFVSSWTSGGSSGRVQLQEATHFRIVSCLCIAMKHNLRKIVII